VQVAEVTSAVPLTPETRTEIEKMVTRQTGLTQISLTEKVDASLIGGFVLRVGDQQIDDSVRGGLRRLRTSLTDKTYTPSLN
jgi:F-type H+-transporting ATPase subunit delta